MPSPGLNSRFVVDLSGLPLGEDHAVEVERAIHEAVLGKIAEIRPKEDLRLRFPWEWRGMVVHTDHLELDQLDKRMREQLGF